MAQEAAAVFVLGWSEVSSANEAFLLKASEAAAAAGHIFAEYAACEAALESSWGKSKLAVEANNLFGQKQAKTQLAGTDTLELSTREYLRGAWVTVPARWIKFVDWAACFRGRMELLRRASGTHPHYASALAAKNGEEFVREVSKTWSTDPARAEKVLSIHRAHSAIFKPA